MGIYLDNAASSCPKPPGVVAAMDACLNELCANPGRGAHRVAVDAARNIYDARKTAASFFGVDDCANIIFTQNATDALNIAIHGYVRDGDHVVSSTIEHNAVARPLKALARNDHVDVTLVPPESDGLIDPEDIAAALKPKTRLVALTHTSNVTAAIQPIAAIGSMLREKGVALLVDAAQSAGAIPIDLGVLPVDMLACTGHKSLMGPQGVGLLCLSPEVELQSVRQGGTGTNSEEEQDSLERPDRYEAGTLNAPGIAGLRAGIEYINETGLAKIVAHKHQLTERLLAGLMSIVGVTVYGPTHGIPRAPLVTFNVSDLPSTETAALLDRDHDIASRAGLHCSPGAHRSLGTLEQGVVRLSVGAFTTSDEIDQALGAVDVIANSVRKD